MKADIITIANRLNRVDSITGLDAWYKSFLSNVDYSKEKISNINGTQVSVGESFNILIPFTGRYVPYLKWKDMEDKDNYYTLSQGDFIFLLKIDDEILPDNIMQIRNKYRSYVCEVRSILEVDRKNGTTIQLKVSGV